jgi:RHS repeat-associated protein
VVNLRSANATVFPIPASVTVPSGATTATFTVNTPPTTINHTVQCTAYIGPITGVYSQAQGTVTVIQAGTPPTVSISSPINNSTVSSGTVPVTATAAATTSGATIAKVDFYVATVTSGTAGSFTAFAEATASPFTVNWQATVGTYEIQAIATDSVGLTATSVPVTVTVSSEQSVTPPSISATSNTGANLANNGTSTGYATITLADNFTPNAGNPVVIYYTIEGSSPNPATSPRYTGPFRIVATTVSSKITINAIAVSAGFLNSTPATAAYTVTPGAKLAAPTASITSPGDGAEAMGQVPIVGVATGPAFGYWEIDYQLAGSTGGWTEYKTGTTAVSKGTITTLDTSLMLDGQYDIRLTVYDTDGQTAQTDNYVVIKGNQKLGYFCMAITDMTVNIDGLPIKITRTYDSRNKVQGDFGVGWTLSTTSVQVQKPEISAFDWEQNQYGGGFGITYALQAVRAHNVTITLPGDTVFSFAETLNPDQSQYEAFADTLDTHVEYQELSGPKATLTPLDGSGNPLDTDVWVLSASDAVVNGKTDPNIENGSSTGQPVQLYEGDLETPYEPGGFILTLSNGTEYKVDASGNLISITDRSGGEVDFSPTGISSKNGQSITLTRSGPYITKITDLSGNSLTYTQDAAGDLTGVTDRNGNTSTYGYDGDHNITSIEVPSGIMPVRNYYYPDGRLDYSLNANNVRINYYYSASVEPGGAQPTSGPVLTVPANAEISTDNLGNPTVTAYDAYGNVTQKTQYLTDATHTNTPVTWTYTYNDADPNNPDKPLSEVDPLGNETDYSYDSLGDVLTTTKYLLGTGGSKTPLKTSATFDSNGDVLTVTDANGVVTSTVTYDANGNPTTTKDALGRSSASTFDSSGNCLSIQGADGSAVHMAYDTNGNMTGLTDALGHVIQFQYDANGNKTRDTETYTSTSGVTVTATTAYVYDPNGNLTQTINPDGSSTRTVLNSDQDVVATIDRLGEATNYKFDVLGEPIETDYPDGTKTSESYDANGNTLVSTDRSGRGTLNTYDTLNRVIQSTCLDANGNPVISSAGSQVTAKTVYDLDGNAIQDVDANGNATSYTFDSLNRCTSESDAIGNVTRYSYDLDGRRISHTDANGHTSTFTYDKDGALLQTNLPDGSKTSSTYDIMGHQISKTDQAGHTTTFGYGTCGELQSVTDPAGDTTTFNYDEFGRKIKQTDANGHSTHFAYDVMGRLVQETVPLGQSETMAYDQAGHLIQKTDFDGVVTKYVVDPTTGNVLSKSTAGQTSVTYTYNGDGTVATSARGNITTSYTYNNTGRLASVAGPNGTVAYEYDGSGNTIQTTITAGQKGTASRTLKYAYDADNRLISVQHSDGQITTYSYDRNGNTVSETRPNGVTTIYSFDVLNRLTGVDNVGSGLPSFVYTLAPDGRRVSVEAIGGTSPGTTNYSYDAADRLTSETVNGIATTYRYDAVGNRTEKVSSGVTIDYSYDNNDRLIQEDNQATGVTTDYGYDANGSQTTVNGVQTYTYDFEGHLVSAPGAVYTYDADGHRLSATTQTGITYYLEDTQVGFGCVADELDGSGNVTATYDYGNDLIRMDRGGNTYYYIFDGRGSTVALTSGAGAVTDTYSYDAFGNPTHVSGTTQNPYLFDGQEFDSETGLYNLRARYYDPATGRFLSQDPKSGYDDDPVSLHRYLYANDDPVNASDPSGKESLIETLTASLIGNVDEFKSVYGTRLLLGWVTRRLIITGFQQVVSAYLAYQFHLSPILTGLITGGLTGLGEGVLKNYAQVWITYAVDEAGAISMKEAESAFGSEAFSIVRSTLNNLFGTSEKSIWASIGKWGAQFIQWHHLVEQSAEDVGGKFGTGITSRAINSILNLVPCPTLAHEAISGYYSSGAEWLESVVPGQTFPRVRDYIRTLPWEQQWTFGLKVYQAAMNGLNVRDIRP